MQQFVDSQFEEELLIHEQMPSHVAFFKVPPPNPIISKPSVKKQHEGLSYMVSKTPRPTFHVSPETLTATHHYLDGFGKINKHDTLLHRLWQTRDQHQLVYLKLQNQKLCGIMESGPKYAAGLFFSVLNQHGKLKGQSVYNAFQDRLGKVIIQSSIQRALSKMQPSFRGLTFSSNFQCGNLINAWRTGTYSYNLVVQNDINSKGYTQWFYFLIKGMSADQTYTFTLMNQIKCLPLVALGMGPFIKSKNQWTRLNSLCRQFQSTIHTESNPKVYQHLTFTICGVQDYCQVAQSLPYSYSKLKDRITQRHGRIMKCTTVGYSINHRDIYMLETGTVGVLPSVVIMARQHPGQTPGSYVLEGLLNALAGQYKQLTKAYNFVIFPMVNPDGVYYGSYRCNLAGTDLNRHWDNPSLMQHPQICCIKSKIRQLHKAGLIALILDLHGHSKKTGAFFYGNVPSKEALVYPKLVSQACSMVNFSDCCFSVTAHKSSTARVVLGEGLGVPVYTFETSFYGYKSGGKIVPFSANTYEMLGQALLKGLQDWRSPKCSLIRQSIQAINISSDDSGSDSEPGEYELFSQQIASLNMKDGTPHHVAPRKQAYFGRIIKNRKALISRSYSNPIKPHLLCLEYRGKRAQRRPIKNSIQSYRILCYHKLGINIKV